MVIAVKNVEDIFFSDDAGSMKGQIEAVNAFEKKKKKKRTQCFRIPLSLFTHPSLPELAPLAELATLELLLRRRPLPLLLLLLLLGAELAMLVKFPAPPRPTW